MKVFIFYLILGLRISEFVGLTIDDIDFDNMVINVDHQLVRVYNEKKSYIIQKTKTTAWGA